MKQQTRKYLLRAGCGLMIPLVIAIAVGFAYCLTVAIQTILAD